MNAAEVRKLRLEIGISQTKLAAVAMLTQGYLSQIELGVKPLTASAESRIRAALKALAPPALAARQAVEVLSGGKAR